MAIDEDYVHRLVRTLQRSGFPASEGYFLVVLRREECEELERSLLSRTVVPLAAFDHPPEMLKETLRFIGGTYALTLGNAVVCYVDHTRADRRAAPS